MNIYSHQKYVVYHTTYSGNKLPANYIGSTSLEQIQKGYKGSVSSKEFKSIWKSEVKANPHLFSVQIISYHDTRPAATYKELQVQKIFNVVTNSLFVNKSYAQPNGFFGMNTSGKNNGNHGKKNKGASGLMFITNGTITRMIKSNEQIPVNWWKGMVIKNLRPKKSKQIKIPFVTVISTRKTYCKNNASRYLPELKQFF